MGVVEYINIPKDFEVVNVEKDKLVLHHKRRNMKVEINNPKYIIITGEVVNVGNTVKIFQSLFEKGKVENYEVKGNNVLIEIWVPDEPACEDDWVFYEQYLKETEETIKNLEKIFKIA